MMARCPIPPLLLPLLLPLLILYPISTSADVFLSIDCGSSDTTYSDELNIAWVGDDNYIQNGQSLTLKDPAGSVSQAMTTLRVFDSRRKNCYPIAVSGGGQILVRASFYYGNYDGKSSPPSFGLQFDANGWTTVETAMDQVVSYEAIYVVNGDATSVCVAQTQPNQLPFISAIEVRSLDANMYAKVDSTYALFLRRRVAFGANNTVRYPDDSYDRIWDPSIVTNGLRALVSDTTILNINISDSPPATVLENAMAPMDASSSINLSTGLPTNEVPIYVNMYFTEMSSLSSTQKRSFEIYMDGDHSEPIVPPYQDVSEYFVNGTADSSTAFTLVPTTDSTLPPIISAMEVFVISDVLSNGTNANDVEMLALLPQQFEVLQDWSGDPCLPASYNWDWLNCSSDETPRITALYLSGFCLSGILPDFSTLDALEIIDLHNNSLSGDIPEFLGNFPNLQELNLADNSFSGSIPSSITQNTKLKLDVSGNPKLCASGQTCGNSGSSTTTLSTSSWSRKRSKNLGLILGLTLPLSFILCAALTVVVYHFNRRRAPTTAAISSTGQQMNGFGKPINSTQAVPMSGTNPHLINNEHRDEIAEQMGSELAVLMEQQAQAQQDERTPGVQ